MRELQIIFERTNLCGCGSGHWDIVMLLLDRAENTLKEGKSFYQEADDASGRWVEFGAKVLGSYDLLEHGSGIGYAWLTDDGTKLLEWLRQHGTDDTKWPEEWCNSSDNQ